MRPLIIFGSALTAAILTSIAAIVGGVVASAQLSVTSGVTIRSFMVIIALAITATIWWLHMTPQDRPEALVVGLMGGWLLNPSSWSGTSYAGQLFTSLDIASVLIDVILWGLTSIGLVLVLQHKSAASTQR